MSAARLYLRRITPNACELVALVNADTMQAAAERNAARAERVGVAVQQSFGSPRFLAVYRLFHRLHDRAQSLASMARRLMDRPSHAVACAECDEPYDIDDTEKIGDRRYCCDCATEVHADMADARWSDDFDFHHDRGHGHGC